ncbi:MAG: hypothetical protein AABY22_14230 [Nanoarchaeota archaeon]
MKFLVFVQSVFGIIAFASFFAIFISYYLFGSREYALLFFSFCFIFLPLAGFLVSYNKKQKFSKLPWFFMILMVFIGGVALYFTLQFFQSHTIYEFELNETDGGFVGSFNVPEDVTLSDKDNTFVIVIKHSSSYFDKQYVLEINGPSVNYNQTIEISGDSESRRTTEYIDSKYRFKLESGDYNFRLQSADFSTNRLISAKIEVREFKE